MKRIASISAAALLSVGLGGCEREPAADAPAQQAQAESPFDDEIYRDDAVTTARVKTALLAEPGVTGFDVDVSTSDRIVTLSGTVRSREQREAAERVARALEGVREVKNELTVGTPPAIGAIRQPAPAVEMPLKPRPRPALQMKG